MIKPLLLALGLMLGVPAMSEIRCDLSVAKTSRIDAPLLLNMTLTNESSDPLFILTWQTPFDGWRGEFLALSLAGQALEYQGIKVKRGAPAPSDYLQLQPGQQASAEIDLTQAYLLNQRGQYRLDYTAPLLDVSQKPTEPANPLQLDCPTLFFSRE